MARIVGEMWDHKTYPMIWRDGRRQPHPAYPYGFKYKDGVRTAMTEEEYYDLS